MDAEARYTYVGAAVLLLVAALVASVVWLSNTGGRGDVRHYAIYFESQALDGLQVGAEVNLRGIKVGRVRDYALSPDKLNRVRVEVSIDPRVPVRTNTVAVVTRNFVTGIAAIALVNREPAGPPLTEAPEGDRLPVIAEGQSNIDQLTGRVSQVGEQASNALASLNELLTPENQRVLMDTVRNLRDLSAGLNQRLNTLDRTLVQAGRAATSVGSAAGQLGQAGERIAGVAEHAGERLDGTLAQTDLTLREARGALGQVAGAMGRLEQQASTTVRRLDDSAAQVEDQLGAAMIELRLSMEATTRVLDRLRDPRAALLGPGRQQLGPGEARP
jgi:phospholipid/cholesterol/gamma-HCH transport system substrate-binding protein